MINLSILKENNAMFNLKDLAEAKSKVKEIRKETSGGAYEQGVKLLEEFEESPNEPDKDKLSLAADKLIEALQFDSENVEAYICLSYIYYILGDDETCLKYLKIAEEIFGEELPEDLVFFRESLKNNMENHVIKELEEEFDYYNEDEDEEEIE